MSIYGILRLLQTRDVGPAQVLPAIDAFGEEVAAKCGAIDNMFTVLREKCANGLGNDGLSAHGLAEAIGITERLLRNTTAQVVETFSAKRKRLGAKERLELERQAERLGGDLQCAWMLLDVLHAACEPRRTPLTLGELCREPWRTRPTFISKRVEVHLIGADKIQIEADPRIMSALILEQIARVVSAGVEKPFATMTAEGDAVLLSVGLIDDVGDSTIERVPVTLAPATPELAAVLAAVADHADIRVCQDRDPGLVLTKLSAA